MSRFNTVCISITLITAVLQCSNTLPILLGPSNPARESLIETFGPISAIVLIPCHIMSVVITISGRSTPTRRITRQAEIDDLRADGMAIDIPPIHLNRILTRPNVFFMGDLLLTQSFDLALPHIFLPSDRRDTAWRILHAIYFALIFVPITLDDLLYPMTNESKQALFWRSRPFGILLVPLAAFAAVGLVVDLFGGIWVLWHDYRERSGSWRGLLVSLGSALMRFPRRTQRLPGFWN